jgi:hypothetical protein
MLKLKTVEGDIVFLNPSHVAAINRTASGTTQVHLADGLGSYTVTSSATSIASSIIRTLGRLST